jgi:hypothetical protein
MEINFSSRPVFVTKDPLNRSDVCRIEDRGTEMTERMETKVSDINLLTQGFHKFLSFLVRPFAPILSFYPSIGARRPKASGNQDARIYGEADEDRFRLFLPIIENQTAN